MSFTETLFLLSERENPHSRVRDNGVRFWGYPQRNAQVSCIVVHTAETAPTPQSAEAVARWQAYEAPAPSSYHVLVDSDSVVRTLEDRAVAFHCVGLNSNSLGLSFATKASLWGRHPEWDQAALRRGAWQAARWCKSQSIPVRWLTLEQAKSGARGFIRHSVADPTRRTDPGRTFPEAEFFRLVNHYLSPDPVEDIMTREQEAKLDEALTLLHEQKDVNRRVRISIRAIANWLHIPTSVNGKTDGTEVIT